MYHQPGNPGDGHEDPGGHARQDLGRMQPVPSWRPFGLPPETRPANPSMRASSQDAGATVATSRDRPTTDDLGMYAATVRVMIRRRLGTATAGDIRPFLCSNGDDAVLILPGRSSWAAG
jgi:hypothetical protein